MKSASHIAFYTRYNISPVRQDIADLTRHFERRESLYRQLGILPHHLHGKRVLEAGPGSGFNSIYTAVLEPSRYLLVEGNPAGIDHINTLFADFPHLRERIEIRYSLLEDFRSKEKFDFVFCEGVLSGINNPHELLDILYANLAPGGVLVVTCVDHISNFPETIRRLFAQMIIEPEQALPEQVARLLPIFAPHLKTLTGMSRRHDDWIIDNLIHPGSVIDNISFPEVIGHLQDRLHFFASSPHFVTDWRWYKDITGKNKDFNQPAINQYWSQAHNLLDYRDVVPPIAERTNRKLYEICTAVRARLRRFEQTRNMQEVKKISGDMHAIIEIVQDFSKKTAASLQEAANILGNMPLNVSALAQSENFGRLFGRGQQYLSMTKPLN